MTPIMDLESVICCRCDAPIAVGSPYAQVPLSVGTDHEGDSQVHVEICCTGCGAG